MGQRAPLFGWFRKTRSERRYEVQKAGQQAEVRKNPADSTQTHRKGKLYTVWCACQWFFDSPGFGKIYRGPW